MNGTRRARCGIVAGDVNLRHIWWRRLAGSGQDVRGRWKARTTGWALHWRVGEGLTGQVAQVLLLLEGLQLLGSLRKLCFTQTKIFKINKKNLKYKKYN